MYDCPEKSSNNLGSGKKGLLASRITKIAPLLESYLQVLWCARQVELLNKYLVLENPILLRFCAVFDYLVYTVICELLGAPSSRGSGSLRSVVIENSTNSRLLELIADL